MALCVSIAEDGTIHPTGEPVDACTGYVMVTGSEYSVYQLVQDVFATPTPEMTVGLFASGLGFVLGAYVIGRCAGAVVAMFNS